MSPVIALLVWQIGIGCWLPVAFAGHAKVSGSKWEGTVLHGMPHLYEADGKTLKAGTGKTPIRLITNRPESGAIGNLMERLVPILLQGVNDINNKSDLLPDYVVELHLCESGCNPKKAVQSTLRQIYNHSRGYFAMQFGPLCSDATAAVNDVIQGFHLMQVASGSRSASLSDGVRYPHLCRTSPTLSFVAEGIAKFLQLFGWTKVGVVMDGTGLNAATITYFKAAIGDAIAGTNSFAAVGPYAFDMEFLDANIFRIDGLTTFVKTVAQKLTERKVRVYVLAMYEDVGGQWFCELAQQGMLSGDYSIVSSGNWWADTWVKDVVDGTPNFQCSVEQVFEACHDMIVIGVSSFIVDNRKHGITGVPRNEIKERYFGSEIGCTAPQYTAGCSASFAPYDYDALALIARSFHKWIYEQGHQISEIDYDNARPQEQLFNITKHEKFEGVTGTVEFFKTIELDCERVGTFSVQQFRFLALTGADVGYVDIVPFTLANGFANADALWKTIIWPTGQETNFGTGYGWRQVAPGEKADFGNAKGLDNIPVDWLVLTCPPGKEPDAALKNCQKCAAGSAGKGGTGIYCEPCGVGFFNKDEGNAICQECSQGQRATVGRTACADCPSGTRGIDGVCKPCGTGSYSAGLGNRFCAKCETGKYQPRLGQDTCMSCAPGNRSNDANPTWCKECQPGFHQDKPGQGMCERCTVGRYQPNPGASLCQKCKNERTTAFGGALEEMDCICPAGSYEPLASESGRNYQCEACKKGMTCELGSTLRLKVDQDVSKTPAIAPILDPGFWSTIQNPVSVFMCGNADDCPGGAPETCRGFLQGRTCALCPDGMTMTRSRLCEECGKSSAPRATLGVAMLVAGVVILVITHVLSNWPSIKLLRANMIGTFLAGMGITAMLLLNVYASMNVTWEQPLVGFFQVTKIFSLDFQVIGLGCFVGSANLRVVRYVSKLLVLPAAFLLMLAGLVSSHLIFPRMRAYTALNKNACLNSLGLLFSIFFVAVCNVSIEGFHCSDNPNGKRTLTSDPSVLCWEDNEHLTYVCLSVVAILAYPVFFLAVTGVIAFRYNALAMKGGPAFAIRVRFLVSRMKPDLVCFGFYYNVRNFAIALIPVVFSSSFGWQILGFAGLFIPWLLAQMHFLPWRFKELNYFDTASSAVHIVCLLCFAMLRAGMDAALSTKEIGWMIICTFSLLVISLLGGGFTKILLRFRRTKQFGSFLSHSKLAIGLFARQVKMMVEAGTGRKVFLDVDNLMNLDNLNFTVRADIGNLVLLVTKEFFTRFWCALEIVTAHMNNVPIIHARVSAEGEDLLSDSFLSNFSSTWSSFELADFNKFGITLKDVLASYQHVASLAAFSMPFHGNTATQEKGIEDITQALIKNAPGIGSRSAKAPQEGYGATFEHLAYLIYDTKCPVQACVARVLDLNLKKARWCTQVCENETRTLQGPGMSKCLETGLVCMSQNLFTNPVCLGLLTSLYQGGIASVAVLSQEEFPARDPVWVEKLRSGGGLLPIEWAVVGEIIPDATKAEIAQCMDVMANTLTLRFNPQDAVTLMNAEFARILERLRWKASHSAPSLHVFAARQSDDFQGDEDPLRSRTSSYPAKMGLVTPGAAVPAAEEDKKGNKDAAPAADQGPLNISLEVESRKVILHF